MFRNFQTISLGIIFLIALLLRLWQLGLFPVGFHIDEASLGYNGYSLLQTGKDENGNQFPLYIDMFGDNRPSGYHYLAALSVGIFGLSEFATRLPGAIFGSISIFVIFFLAQVLFKNNKLSLLSALFLAIAPWHIVLSRASAETIISLFFILAGFAFVIRSWQRWNRKELIIGSISFVASFFFYHTPRVFVPLLFLLLQGSMFLRLGKSMSLQYRITSLVSFILITVFAILLVFFVAGGSGRFTQVSIFGHPETKLILEEQIREDGVSGTVTAVTRTFHNKLINYGLTFISNYFMYFDGNFLFIEGGLPMWYNVPGMGLLYITLSPFLFIGFISLVRKRELLYYVPILWILVAPVVAAITVDDIPNIQRAIVLFPMIEIVAAYGFVELISNFQLNRVLALIFSLAVFFNFLYFMHQYFVHAKLNKPWNRNNGTTELMEEIGKVYDQYDIILITKSTGGIYPLVLFFSKYSPSSYQQEGSTKDRDYTGFGKYFFVPARCPSIDRDDRFPKVDKILYIDRGDCASDPLAVTKDIYREDGTGIYRIIYE